MIAVEGSTLLAVGDSAWIIRRGDGMKIPVSGKIGSLFNSACVSLHVAMQAGSMVVIPGSGF